MKQNRNLGLLLFFTIFLLIVFRFQIGDFLLKNFGRLCVGTVISDVRSVKYVKPTFLYQFYLNDNRYLGNTTLSDSSKIGMNICIVYLPYIPSINRPAFLLNKECGLKTPNQ